MSPISPCEGVPDNEDTVLAAVCCGQPSLVGADGRAGDGVVVPLQEGLLVVGAVIQHARVNTHIEQHLESGGKCFDFVLFFKCQPTFLFPSEML